MVSKVENGIYSRSHAMKLLLWSLLSCLTLLMLVDCGKKENPPAGPTDQDKFAQKLNGSWESNCQIQADGTACQSYLLFKGKEVTCVHRLFTNDNNDCSAFVRDESYFTGTYTLGGKFQGGELFDKDAETFEIDYTLKDGRKIFDVVRVKSGALFGGFF